MVDLDAVPKAWTYFLHHTLNTNRSDFELIIMRGLELYLLLTQLSVNIRKIISGDKDDMAQSMTKKSLGHAYVILLLCKKVGVVDFIDGRMVHPTRALNAA